MSLARLIRLAFLTVGVAACRPTTPAPSPPAVEPVLHAVLHPGTPPRFARRTPGRQPDEYELLPSPAILLRLTSPFPQLPRETEIVIAPMQGTRTPPLRYVDASNSAQQQALADSGYFWIVADPFGYTVGVAPPTAQRSGAGFDIVLRNRAANPPAGSPEFSSELRVRVRPQIARTLPSSVFFDCPGQVQGWWLTNCKPGAPVAVPSFTIEGWLDVVQLGAFYGMAEDVHYYFVPDVDFVDAYYGPNGMMHTVTGRRPFANAVSRGNPPLSSRGWQRFEDLPTGSSAAATTIHSIAAFASVHKQDRDSALLELKAELNAWHVNDVDTDQSTWSMRGRGAAPPGWISWVPAEATDPSWRNTRWPYHPRNPDLGPADLSTGHCVRITGALYLDSMHGDGIDPGRPTGWLVPYPSHAGWWEIHPPDWIERIPCPAVLKTPLLVSFLGDVGDSSSVRLHHVFPKNNPTDVLEYREIVDGRYTNGMVERDVWRVGGDGLRIDMRARADRAGYKAIFLLWWKPAP